jgi:hypothetical protein
MLEGLAAVPQRVTSKLLQINKIKVLTDEIETKKT